MELALPYIGTYEKYSDGSEIISAFSGSSSKQDLFELDFEQIQSWSRIFKNLYRKQFFNNLIDTNELTSSKSLFHIKSSSETYNSYYDRIYEEDVENEVIVNLPSNYKFSIALDIKSIKKATPSIV